MISNETPVCAASEARQAPRQASSLRAGTMTETFIRSADSLETVSVAAIAGILYYSWVRRFSHPAAAFLTCISMLGLVGCYSNSRPPRIGSNAPDFTVRDADNSVTLSQLRGQVVVLNFWATWCPPCVEELPSLVEMQRRMKAKGVTVVAVSVDVDEGAYRQFVKEHNVNLLTVRDPDQNSNSLYG